MSKVHFDDLDGFLKTVVVASSIVVIIYLIYFIIGLIMGFMGG